VVIFDFQNRKSSKGIKYHSGYINMTMVIPIIILLTIPIFFGIVAVSPFDQFEEFNEEIILEPEFNEEIILEPEFNEEIILEPEFNGEISSELGVNVLYFLLIVIWTIILLRIVLQIKKGTFKITQRY